MILLVGIPSEPPMRAVIEACDALGLLTTVMNQRHLGDCELVMRTGDGMLGGWLGLKDSRVPLDELSAVFLRLMDYRQLPEYESDRDTQERFRVAHEAILDVCELADALILNRASATATNGSKPFQSRLIQTAGFAVPETLVTNDAELVREFVRVHTRVVFKSISAVRSVVRELDARALTRLDRLRLLPTQFQAYVPGTNLRVHVVGDDVHTTEINSTAIDYRYAGRQGLSTTMRQTLLPAEVSERCLTLSASLGLPLCGIDLKRTPDGEYFCFEVNPSPAFSYYEQHTHQPIAASIARLLASAGGASARR